MIKFNTIYAGPNGVYTPGQTADLGDEEKALIAGGYADPCESGAPPKGRSRKKAETATDPAAEGSETTTA